MENAKKYYKEFKALRAQLENQGKSKSVGPQNKAKTAQQTVHNDKKAVDAPMLGEADIDNVELNEEDMTDPDLLRELKMMGYKETKPVDAKKSLEDKMDEYKTKALNAKKAGDLENAKKYYKEFKALRAQLESLQ